MGGMEWVGKRSYHNRLSQPSKNLWCYRWCNVGINDSCPKMCSTFFPSNIIAVLPSSLPQSIMLTHWTWRIGLRWSFSVAAPPSFWTNLGGNTKGQQGGRFCKGGRSHPGVNSRWVPQARGGPYHPPSSFLKQNSGSLPITSMFLNVSNCFPAPRQDILVEKHQRQGEAL